MKTRLYEVHTMNADVVFLVEAGSQAAARAHVARKFVGDVVVPDGRRIADLMSRGVKVEDATKET